jgi:hypothetical protein
MPTYSFAQFFALSQVLPAGDLYTVRMESDAEGNVQYVGKTTVSNAETDALVWDIRKFNYDLNGNLEHIQQPDDGPGLLYAWDDRVTIFT